MGAFDGHEILNSEGYFNWVRDSSLYDFDELNPANYDDYLLGYKTAKQAIQILKDEGKLREIGQNGELTSGENEY